jgi:hypothetical protein
MEVLREKNGNKLLVILEIGRIIGRMDSVFNSIRMEINTKECGIEIKDTVKVLTGETKAESFEENILEIGSKTRNTAEAHFSIRMEIGTMDTGLMECLKGRAE